MLKVSRTKKFLLLAENHKKVGKRWINVRQVDDRLMTAAQRGEGHPFLRENFTIRARGTREMTPLTSPLLHTKVLYTQNPPFSFDPSHFNLVKKQACLPNPP